MPNRSAAADAALEAALCLASDQAGLITRRQAIQAGMSDEAVKWRLRSRRWWNVFGTGVPGGRRSVYATFSGHLDSSARLWAAILVCGDGATLSHESAAELHGLIDMRGRRSLIHVTVPSGRKILPPDGIGLHYSGRLAMSRHPALQPPRTRVEDTVIDVTQSTPSLDHASALVAGAVQRRLTTPDRLAANINGRSRVKWRAELLEMCGVVGNGAHSLLEVRYVKDVERAHGLPVAERQVRLKGVSTTTNGNIYVDNRYTGYGLIVELDGRRGHTGDGVFRDMWRDNATVIQGERTIRLGFGDVTSRPCETAAIIAVVLDYEPVQCSRTCGVLKLVQKLKAHDRWSGEERSEGRA